MLKKISFIIYLNINPATHNHIQNLFFFFIINKSYDLDKVRVYFMVLVGQVGIWDIWLIS